MVCFAREYTQLVEARSEPGTLYANIRHCVADVSDWWKEERREEGKKGRGRCRRAKKRE